MRPAGRAYTLSRFPLGRFSASRTFWVYQDEGILGSDYVDEGQECLNVFTS